MYWTYPECTGDVPSGRRAHTATTVEDRIFLFGGGDGPNYFDELYILDTSELLPPLSRREGLTVRFQRLLNGRSHKQAARCLALVEHTQLRSLEQSCSCLEVAMAPLP